MFLAVAPKLHSDELPNYVNKLSGQDKASLRLEYERHMNSGELNAAQFRRATACTAKDEVHAREFFSAVCKYAFENGEEPDIMDYWNR